MGKKNLKRKLKDDKETVETIKEDEVPLPAKRISDEPLAKKVNLKIFKIHQQLNLSYLFYNKLN